MAIGKNKTVKTAAEAAAAADAKADSLKKVRTATKKYFPKTVDAAAGPTKLVKKTKTAISSVATEEARAQTKASLNDKWTKYKTEAGNKIKDAAKKRASNMLTKGLDPLISNALTTVLNTVNEPILLATLKNLANDSQVDPLYHNGYCIKEFMKRDFSTIIDWLIDKYGYSVVNGSNAKYFNALQYGATDCALVILKHKVETKGDNWYQQERYKEVKNIIKSCSMNFTKDKIVNLLEYGCDEEDGIDPPIIETTEGGSSDGTDSDILPVKYMRKILPSGYGDTGCYEFDKKFTFSKSEINSLFPERLEPNFKQYKVTYPKTSAHVDLFKYLMDESVYGVDRLVSDEIYRRLYDNQIYNPIVNEALGLANDALKATGLDKIVAMCMNRESLMYTYIKWLVDEKYI